MGKTYVDTALLAEMIASSFRADRGWQADEALPSSLDDAYGVQHLAARRTGLKRQGYKIGATNAAAQRALGASGALFGPVFEDSLISDAGDYQVSANALGAEIEIAFVMARDFVEPLGALDRNGLCDAIASCHVAIEVAHRRLRAERFDQIGVVCDLCFTGAVRLGPAIADWTSIDLAGAKVTAMLNDVEVARGSGADALSHPLDALLWLVRALRAQDRNLRAGDIVITGSCSGITPLQAGDRFRAEIEGLGSLGLSAV
jgi:2-keto-4-pentenoate hydratase